ncbi:unnamed protein product [Rhizophagus irregularis]|nr:unnamed protein product [Rhizophagus irregularis]
MGCSKHLDRYIDCGKSVALNWVQQKPCITSYNCSKHLDRYIDCGKSVALNWVQQKPCITSYNWYHQNDY